MFDWTEKPAEVLRQGGVIAPENLNEAGKRIACLHGVYLAGHGG